MDIVKIKIHPDENITKYVVIIRKAYPSASIADIKRSTKEILLFCL